MVWFSALFRQGVRFTPGMQAAALGSSIGIALAGGALTGQFDAYSNENICEFRGFSWTTSMYQKIHVNNTK